MTNVSSHDSVFQSRAVATSPDHEWIVLGVITPSLRAATDIKGFNR